MCKLLSIVFTQIPKHANNCCCNQNIYGMLYHPKILNGESEELRLLRKTFLVNVLIFCVLIDSTNTVFANNADKNVTLLNESISPIPKQANASSAKTRLGKRLFYDPILSNQNKLSCSSCHDPKIGGASPLRYSLDTNGRPLSVNTPTILNSVFNRRQNWNGRIGSFEAQIDESIVSSRLMNTTWASVIRKLKQDESYAREFRNVYLDNIRPDHVKEALISYIKLLTTPNSRFDQYLRGDKNAISADEKAGYEEFKSHGCIACHQGINVGGNVFEKFGIFGNYFKDNGEVSHYDKGRYNITGRQRDLYVFRVPSLRNVEHTAPYFHDGSAKTLKEAVKTMSKYQLGSIPSKTDIDLMVKFLLTLTSAYSEN